MKTIFLALFLVNFSAYSYAEKNDSVTNDIIKTSDQNSNSKQLVNTYFTRLQDAPLINITESKQQDYYFDSSAPVFNFPTGKSFFHVFRLPNNTPNLLIKLSTIVGDSIFMPTIDFYNKNWEFIKRLPESSFSHRANNPIFNDSVFYSEVELKYIKEDLYNNPTFMVVYSTAKGEEMTVSLPNPEKQLALANGAVAPDVPDIQLPYAATGTINIKFIFKPGKIEQLISATENLIANPTVPAINMTNNNNDKILTKLQSTGEIDKARISSQKMYLEVEEFYNEQIYININRGNLNKAWELAKEAAQAGSPTAVDTYMQELIKTQK